MKRYIKDNKKIFKIINNEKYQIINIKPVKKKIKKVYYNMMLLPHIV